MHRKPHMLIAELATNESPRIRRNRSSHASGAVRHWHCRTCCRRAQRRLPEREQQQEVDEEEPKLLGHERAQGAGSREVPLRPRRALHDFRDEQVDHHEDAQVGKKLKHESREVPPTVRPRHPLIPLKVQLRIERLRRVVHEREERQGLETNTSPRNIAPFTAHSLANRLAAPTPTLSHKTPDGGRVIDSPVVRAGAHGERHRGGHLARVERRPTRRRNARNARDVQPARAEDVVERGGVVGGELVGDDERLGEIVGC